MKTVDLEFTTNKEAKRVRKFLLKTHSNIRGITESFSFAVEDITGDMSVHYFIRVAVSTNSIIAQYLDDLEAAEQSDD